MKEERNALQKEVFPKLRKLCMEHGFRFQAIDLRWGVSEEAGLDQQTMKICLEEIERSQRVSPKPNFIVLLGDRYGWRPLPYEIPADEFDEIKKVVSPSDKDFLFWEGNVLEDDQLKKREGWYCRDENAVPPVYCLKPRLVDYDEDASDDEIKDARDLEYKDWEDVEKRLKSILLNAIDELGWDKNDSRRFKYESSATEQEIIKGVLNLPKNDSLSEEHVFSFIRKIKGKKCIPFDDHSKDFFDFTASGTIDASAEEKLIALKDKIDDVLPSSNIFDYVTEWEEKGVSRNHIEKLCDDVYSSLEKVINEQINEFEDKDLLNIEIEAHKEFGEERCKFFIGREDNRAQIKNYLEKPNPKPLIVYGESGSGKSALMAQALEDLYPNFYKTHIDNVIVRFIGATPESSDIRSLLESLSRQITKIYNEYDFTIPNEYNDLVQDFKERLNFATAEKPLFIFLDALDQLSDSDSAHNLTWLPDELPENVHIVISTLKNIFQSLLEHRYVDNTVEVLPLEKNDARNILEAWFNDNKRKLTDEQENEIISKFEVEGLPLYLKLAFEESKLLKSYTSIPKFQSDIKWMINSLFGRLSRPENHGETLVSRSLGYLSAAKNGLTEDEMLDILALDEDVFSLTKKYHNPPEDKLPIALWSRLYFDLEPYLTERSADGTSLLTFYHRQLSEVVKKLYLPGEKKIQKHRTLAKYFEDQPLTLETRKNPNIRKVSELPYQQTYGNLPEDIEKTLTDLLFIEAKFIAGMGYDLLNDYKRVGTTRKIGPPIVTARYHEGHYCIFCPYCLTNSSIDKKILGNDIICPECMKKLKINPFLINNECQQSKRSKKVVIEEKDMKFDISQNVFEFTDFIQSQMHILINNPEITLQQAANQQDDSIVSLEAKKIIQQENNRKWIEWKNKPKRKTPLLMKLTNHNSIVSFCVFSPDGERIASASVDGTVRVWDASTGEELIIFEGHSSSVDLCMFSPDGERIASASVDGTVRVWDASTGEELIIFEGNSNSVDLCMFSPDGEKIAFRSIDGGVCVWDLETKKELIKIKSDTFRLFYGVFSPDSKRIVTTSTIIFTKLTPPVIKVWDVVTGEELMILESHLLGGNSSVFSPDGGKIAATDVSDICVWDAETGNELYTLKYSLRRDLETVNYFVFSPDGEKIASAIDNGNVRVWDAENGEELLNISAHSSSVSFCVFSPDGERIASASVDGTVRVWDASTGEELIIFEGHSSSARSCVFSPDGEKIASIHDSNVCVWDARTESDLIIFEGRNKYLNFCVFSPDGERIASVFYDGTVRVWDASTGEELIIFGGHSSSARSCVFSPDGGRIVSGFVDGTVRVWDASTGEELIIFGGHSSSVSFCVFSPDGGRIVSGSGDRTVIWDVKTGKDIINLEGNVDYERFCVFSPDGGRIASFYSRTHYDDDVYKPNLPYVHAMLSVFDIDTGKELKLKDNLFDVFSCDFSPDGKTILATSGSNELTLWDAQTGETKLTIKMGYTNFFCVFSPDGERIASASGDTVWVWDASTGEELIIFEGHSSSVRSCVFSPDGARIVSGSVDGTVRIWDVKTGRIIYTFSANDSITISLFSSNGLIAGYDNSGSIYILCLHGIDRSIPIITPVRLYLFDDHVWDSHVTANCSCCRERFDMDQNILDNIPSIKNRIQNNRRNLKLVNGVGDARLIIKCPNCNNKLICNPFIIDNSKKWWKFWK